MFDFDVITGPSPTATPACQRPPAAAGQPSPEPRDKPKATPKETAEPPAEVA